MQSLKPYHEMEEIEKMVAFEQGALSTHQIIHFFQELIDNGMIKNLQGSYRRTAKFLMHAGLISKTPEKTKGSECSLSKK